MYAVVSTQGHQYIVSEGDKIVVDVMSEIDEGGEVVLEDVLCLFEESASVVTLGSPLVKGASIKAKLIRHQLGDKIRVMKFQSKKRYQRVKGFRPKKSVLQIEKIIS